MSKINTFQLISKLQKLTCQGLFQKIENLLIKYLPLFEKKLEKLDLGQESVEAQELFYFFEEMADIHIFLGNYEEIVNSFYRIIYNNPNICNLNIFIKFAILLFIQGKYQESQDIMFKALTIIEKLEQLFEEPMDDEKCIVYRYIAEIFKKQFKYSESEQFYKKVNPDYFNEKIKKNYLYGLSDLYILQNRYSEAEEALKSIDFSWPSIDGLPIKFCLADLYILQEKFEEAEQIYKDVIENNPCLSLYLIAAANLKIISGQFEDAEEFFKKAVKINPEIETKFFFLKRHLSLYKNKGCNAEFKRIIKLLPKIAPQEMGEHEAVQDFIILYYESSSLTDCSCTYSSFYLGLKRCADLVIAGGYKPEKCYLSFEYLCVPPIDGAIQLFFRNRSIYLR